MDIMQILNATYFDNTILQYLEFFGILGLSIIIGKVVHYVVTRIVKVFTGKTKTRIDDILIEASEKPAIILVLIIGYIYGFHMLTLTEWWDSFYHHSLNILVIVAVTWFLVVLIDKLIITYLVPLADKSENDLDDHLIPIIRKVIKFSIIIISIILIISNLGYDVTTLLAGVGLGGLAFAFAAQETLKNLFGGLAIIADKPFKLRDWVQIGGIQGTVEEIGIRSTRLKTIEGNYVTIPNSVINSQETINYKKYSYKKKLFKIGLTYDTPADKIDKAKSILRKIIEKGDHVIKDSIEINFLEFSAYSLDIEARFDFGKNDAQMIRGAMDRMNLEIKKQFEKEGISFAFPTQTIEIRKSQ